MKKADSIKFSVIIPTYNSARFIEPTLKSVINQSHQNFEVIVVDDGSVDETKKVLNKYRAKIKYFKLNHGGVARARNLGIAKAKGDYVAFLDHDDLWPKNRLREIAKTIGSKKPLVIVNDCKIIDELGKIQKVRTYHGQNLHYRDLLSFNPIISPSQVVVQAKFLKRNGGFDEKLAGHGSEDWDLWLRLIKKTPFRVVHATHTLWRDYPKSADRDVAMYRCAIACLNKNKALEKRPQVQNKYELAIINFRLLYLIEKYKLEHNRSQSIRDLFKLLSGPAIIKIIVNRNISLRFMKLIKLLIFPKIAIQA